MKTDPNAAAYEDYTRRLTEWRAADPATRGPVPEYEEKSEVGSRKSEEPAPKPITTKKTAN